MINGCEGQLCGKLDIPLTLHTKQTAWHMTRLSDAWGKNSKNKQRARAQTYVMVTQDQFESVSLPASSCLSRSVLKINLQSLRQGEFPIKIEFKKSL